MAKTFCGKDCDMCNAYIEHKCTGCKDDDKKGLHTDCGITECCWNKGHAACSTCTHLQGCTIVQRKDDMQEHRAQKQLELEQKKKDVVRKAPFMAKWLTALFWLLIAVNIIALTDLSVIKDISPVVSWYGERVLYICAFVEGVILLILSKEENRYQIAGFCTVAISVISFLMLVLPVNENILLQLGPGIISIIGMYYLYTGHSHVVRDANAELANQWTKLWKWTMIGLGGASVSILALFISSVIALLGILVFGIILVGTAVLQLVYLYRMAKLFQNIV